MYTHGEGDVSELVLTTYYYFTEYGTQEQELSCLRALKRLRPMPKGCTTLADWAKHILSETRAVKPNSQMGASSRWRD